MRAVPREGFGAFSKSVKVGFIRGTRARREGGGGTLDGVAALLEGLAKVSDDYVFALDTSGQIVWAEEGVLDFLRRGRSVQAAPYVEDVIEGADVAGAARLMGRLLADAPVEVPHAVRLRGEPPPSTAVLVSAWKLALRDGSALVVGFVRLRPPMAG